MLFLLSPIESGKLLTLKMSAAKLHKIVFILKYHQLNEKSDLMKIVFKFIRMAIFIYLLTVSPI